MHYRQNTGIRRHVASAVLLIVCLAASLGAGCSRRVQVRVVPDALPLDVPLPPPRLVEAAEATPPEPLTLPPEPAQSAPSRARTPPVTTSPSDAAKPEPPKASEEPKATPATTTLRTTPTREEGELERRIGGLLIEATSHLNRTDYSRLNADGRNQYDSAKAFVRQAEEALRIRNLVFASYLADKAATLAVQLRGR